MRPSRTAAVLAALLAAAVLVPARAAAPWAVVVSGPPLAAPVILTDRQENHRLLLAVRRDAGLSWSELDGRPYLWLTLYWGEWWEVQVRQGRLPTTSQQGRFYPAVGDRPAAVVIHGAASRPVPQLLEAEGLAILAAHGVPVRLAPDAAAALAPAALLGAAAAAGR